MKERHREARLMFAKTVSSYGQRTPKSSSGECGASVCSRGGEMNPPRERKTLSTVKDIVDVLSHCGAAFPASGAEEDYRGTSGGSMSPEHTPGTKEWPTGKRGAVLKLSSI